MGCTIRRWSMPVLNFSVYFDGKTHRIKRIVAHAEWCDYECESCPHEKFCERVYKAIEEVEHGEDV